MLGIRALLDESIANAARFILRRVGRKIGPSSAVAYTPSDSTIYNSTAFEKGATYGGGSLAIPNECAACGGQNSYHTCSRWWVRTA